jgi:hypothetical protein
MTCYAGQKIVEFAGKLMCVDAPMWPERFGMGFAIGFLLAATLAMILILRRR